MYVPPKCDYKRTCTHTPQVARMKLRFRVERFDTIRRARKCLEPGAAPLRPGEPSPKTQPQTHSHPSFHVKANPSTISHTTVPSAPQISITIIVTIKRNSGAKASASTPNRGKYSLSSPSSSSFVAVQTPRCPLFLSVAVSAIRVFRWLYQPNSTICIGHRRFQQLILEPKTKMQTAKRRPGDQLRSALCRMCGARAPHNQVLSLARNLSIV